MQSVAAEARRTRTPQPEGLAAVERKYDLRVLDFTGEVDLIRAALKRIPRGFEDPPARRSKRARRPGAEACSVVDGNCLAPANSSSKVRTKCHQCGQHVCTECSSYRTYDGVRRRVCNNCQVEKDGEEARVMLRMYHQAGYRRATLSQVRSMLAGESPRTFQLPWPGEVRPPRPAPKKDTTK